MLSIRVDERITTMHDIKKPPNLVIGLTGPLGSGVSTTSEVLQSKGFLRISVSDQIRAEYRTRNGVAEAQPLPKSPEIRNALQDLGNELRAEKPEYWIEKAVGGDLGDTPVVIDGIRNLNEVQWLRKTFPQFFLAAVVAPKDSRWNRLKAVYDSNMKDFEIHDARDSDEDIPNGQQVQKCVIDADYVFLNKDTEYNNKGLWHESIWKNFGEAVQLMQGKDARPAWKSEIFMAVAYAQSHMSQCLKRRVGAVIVEESGIPLSLGYNENPVGMLPCKSQFNNHCFKDMDMEDKLINTKDLFCPFCGEKNEELSRPWLCKKCRQNLKAKLFPSRNMELCTAIHAEERAIRSLHGRNAELSTMYVTTFPCFQCSRYIVDAKISKVIYVEPYPVKEAAKFLETNRVSVEPFEGFKARAFNQIFKLPG